MNTGHTQKWNTPGIWKFRKHQNLTGISIFLGGVCVITQEQEQEKKSLSE